MRPLQDIESVFDLHNKGDLIIKRARHALEESFDQIKDKIQVLIGDVETEVGIRYAMLLGIDLRYDSLP